MKAAQLLARLRRDDIRMWAEDGELRYDAPRGAMTPELRDAIRGCRDELLDLLRRSDRARSSSTLERVSRDGRLPLSFPQQRLWFLSRLDPDSHAYHVPVTVGLKGPLEVERLRRALSEIVRRHEILRTTFPEVDGQAGVRILPPAPLLLPVRDLRTLPGGERWDEALRRSATVSAQPFDLGTGPLLRAMLFRLDEHEYVLHLVMHHIICDGWSLGVLFRELSAVYEAYSADHPSPLPERDVQYVDFAAWQRERLSGAALEGDLDYWRRQLADVPTLDLPTDRPRPAVRSHEGNAVWLKVPPEIFARLQKLSQQENATLFMTLLAAFKLLLGRWAAKDDVVVGTTVAGRNHRETEDLIGFFINSLVLRTDLAGGPTFRELLQRVRRVVLDAFAHGDVPFEKLVDELQPERTLNRNPLFQVLFSDFVMSAVHDGKLGPLEITAPDTALKMAKFDLTLHCYEDAGRRFMKFEYSSDLFDAETIERLGAQYVQLLQGIAATPDVPITRLRVMTDAERHRLLEASGGTDATPAPRRAVHELFEDHARRTPDEDAVVFEDQRLTYRELEARTRRLALRLRALGVEAESRVGLFFDRSAEMMIALLGVLRAGGSYVPLDPGAPPDRLRFMLDDSAIKIVLTHAPREGEVRPHGVEVVLVDDPVETGGAAPENDLPEVRPENLAYVIYTSGSTGQPKGVEVEHAQLSSYVHGIGPRLDLPAGTRFATVSTLAADLGNTVIFAALCGGGTLHILSEERIGDGEAFGAYMQRESIECIKIVPSHLQALLAAARRPQHVLPARLLVLGGEASSWDLIERVETLQPNCVVINHYGPTETTVGVMTHRIERGDRERFPFGPPIGLPLSHTRAYVLDPSGEPVPDGSIGELHIGGLNVARGYQNQPELSRSAFAPDHLAPAPGARRYRTGDLVRRLRGGEIHFVGRADQQVKIRGFRIEMGEIESALRLHPSVESGVVVVHEDDDGRKQLVAYLVTNGKTPPTISDLRSTVREKLPEYMVPSAYVFLPSLPLTPNGKLDRRSLPSPDAECLTKTEAYVAPETPTQETLAQIWSDVLRVERIGIHDNFFELGGESILSIQIISRVTQSGLQLTPRDLFEHPTIAELARVVREATAVRSEQGLVSGAVPVTPVQHRFFEHDQVDRHHYNHARLLSVPQDVRPELVETALERVLAHHDALRSRFACEESTWTQRIVKETRPVPFTCVDLRDVAEVEQGPTIEAMAADLQSRLDLIAGPLLQVVLFQLGDRGADRLLIVVHHLVVDIVSWTILLEDLETAYKQLERDGTVELPAKTTSFRAWAERLTRHARSTELQDERPYWQSVVEREVARLPIDHGSTDAENTGATLAAVSVSLTEAETRALLFDVPRAYKTQINDVLLTALAQTLAAWTGGTTVRIDAEGHGREPIFEDLDVSRTVGWFTAVYPVVLELAGAEDPGAALRSIKEQLRAIPNRGIGWGLLRYLSGDRSGLDAAQTDVAEVGFNYFGRMDRTASSDTHWHRAGESTGPTSSPRNRRRYVLDVVGAITDGQLRVDWVYSDRRHERTSVENAAGQFLTYLRELIAHCATVETPRSTPSDHPFATLTPAELERLEQRYPAGIENVFELSPLQKGMVYHTLAEADSTAYTTQLVFTLRGDLDAEALRTAWQRVVDHHTVLRTGVVVDGLSEMHQVVSRTASLRWMSDDWRGLEDDERRARLEALAEAERTAGFDLAAPPLMRLHLVRTGEDQWRFVWTHHHVLLDGWSLPLLIKDVFRAYNAAQSGRVIEFEPSPPFSEYFRWLQRQDQAEADEYWRQRLADWYEPTPLPARAGSGQPGAASSRCLTTVDEAASAALQALARRNQLTLNTIVQGAWALLLARYAGTSDVVFGVTISGRPPELPGVESMLGMFINTLPLRIDTSDTPLLSWLHGIQSRQLELQRFEFSPLYEIQRLSGGGSGTRLFDSIFVFENYPAAVTERGDRGGLDVEDPEDYSFANYPLAAVIRPGRELSLQLRYDGDRFEDATIERMLDHLRALLVSMAERPEARLSDLPMLGAAERDRMLVEWNDTRTPYPADRCVHDLFADQAARTPQAIAVEFGDDRLTYGDVDSRANQLAHALRAHGVGSGSLVAICLDRGVDFVVGLLGILKAGAAYVPIDADYPAQRIELMLADAGVSALVTHEHTLSLLPPHEIPAICLEWGQPTLADQPTDDPAISSAPDDPAYVIYTSGSTGRPKGSCIPHRAISRLVLNTDYVQIASSDRIAQASNVSFDAATFEIWGGLLNGATIVGVSKDVALSPTRFAEVIRTDGLTILFVTTALFNQLSIEVPGIFGPLRCLLFGGEAVDPARVRAVLAHEPPEQLLHVYGPTENTTFSTWYPVHEVAPDATTVPIGRPIANTTSYVLDEHLNPVPIGAPGELYLGGDGLALGYLNDPDLTRAKFIAHPFEDGERVYRTGDLVRCRPDGHVDFVGRIDHQVKVRGFRIELGEIETTLQRSPMVRESLVLCRQDEPGEKVIVAYVVATDGSTPTRGDLRAHLGATLPEYMLPSAFVFLEEMPLNQNGKIDRRALPAPRAERDVAEEYTAPRSELEAQLAAVWCDVLGVEQVGIRDNFFDLGGHSLRLLSVHRRLVDELDHDLSVTDLFQFTTIEALAERLGEPAAPVPELQEWAMARVGRRTHSDENSVAIIGMAGYLPGARDPETFWENLCAGVESIRFFSDDELREAGASESLLRNPRLVKARAALDDIGLFDAWFFGYNPREAELIDPQHRLFLECACEALERAAYDPSRYDGLIGVYAGVAMNTYLANLQSQPEILRAAGGLQRLIGADKDFLATRVAYKLNLRGPSLSVQTACSTSLVAIHQACRSLVDQQCDIALAGGVAVTVPSIGGYLYEEAGIRSPDGHCRPFDARAQGTVTGNGVAIVVLKRLSEALRDGDHVHAVIRGTAINNDGSAKVGFTAPSVEGQSEAIALAHACAGVAPDSIGYIEAHGTATALGDPIEVAALTRVFREHTSRTRYCALGSLKSNMGHLNDAAGAAGVMKTALALEHRTIPPSLHYEQPNPEIDFANSPFFVNTECRDWVPIANGPRRAGVSSFGLGGTNAHAVLEEAPVERPSGPSRRWQMLVLSARNEAALDASAANLADRLRHGAPCELADVAYTLHVGRREFEHRRAVLGRTPDDVIAALQGEAPQRSWSQVAPAYERPVVFMFPGQGAQYADMARGLLIEPAFREAVEACLSRLEGALEFDLRAALFPGDEDRTDAATRLRRTSVAQPALFVIEYALAELWRSWGIEPAACIGHSIGEFTAACVSGVLTLEDALDLVALRGRLMERMPEGVMLAVPAEAPRVRALLEDEPDLWLSAVNGPRLCVVSGTADRVTAFEDRLGALGLEGRRLHTSHAFHSGLMTDAVKPFVEAAARVDFGAPKIPYVSNVTGDWVTESDVTDPEYWGHHIRNAVRFSEGMEHILAESRHVLLEVGPGQVLASLARHHDACGRDRLIVSSLRQARSDEDDLAHLLGAAARLWTGGVAVDWPRFYASEQRRRIVLPTYPFQRQRYWVERRADGGRQRPTRRAVEDWFSVRVWRPSAWPTTPAVEDDSGVLVFVDGSTLGHDVARGLATAGRRVVVVEPGASFGPTPGGYTIDPAAASQYGHVVSSLLETGDLPSTIVYLSAADTTADWLDDSASRRCQERGFHGLLHLTRALAELGVVQPIRLNVVTAGAHDVAGGERVDPGPATSLGLCRVADLEFPNVTCRNIDLPAATALDENAAARLALELTSTTPDTVVAHRRGRRWVESFAPAPLDPVDDTANGRLRDGGTYLITGGLGGMGLALAGSLARSNGARLVLTSRTPLPDRGTWTAYLAQHEESDVVGNAIRAVQSLEQAGAQVLVVGADVSDADSMRSAIAEAERRFGTIHGVIHAAGIPASGLVMLEETERVAAVLAPKVRGAQVLGRLFAEADLDFLVLCSSLNAIKGFPGAADYSAANAYLDAFARRYTAETGTFTVSINWNRWRDVGMAVKAHGRPLAESQGITNDEGVEVFRRVLGQAPDAQVLVSEYDLWTILASAHEAVRAATPSAEATSAPPDQPATPTSSQYPRPSISTEFVAARTDRERRIAEIWQELFGIDRVGVHDNFFELGGHSLLATQLLNRLMAECPAAGFSLRVLFDQSTVAELASRVDDVVATGPPINGVGETDAPPPREVPHHPRATPDPDLALADVAGMTDEDVDRALRQLLEEGEKTP